MDELVIPEELVEHVQRSNVVLFAGAGISSGESGLPNGGILAQELAQRGGLGNVHGMSLPEVAQRYELRKGYHSLIDYICRRISHPKYVPQRAHELIAALPFKNIITTNWDNLLEEALRRSAKDFVKVVRDSEVSFWDEQKVGLIKLHGSIEQKDSIVVTGDDYYEVFSRLPEVANFVQATFAARTVLFLGYGLADADFKRLHSEVFRHIGRHKRRAYAVQLNPDVFTVEYWKRKNVQLIAADATEFLQALATRLGVR